MHIVSLMPRHVSVNQCTQENYYTSISQALLNKILGEIFFILSTGMTGTNSNPEVIECPFGWMADLAEYQFESREMAVNTTTTSLTTTSNVSRDTTTLDPYGKKYRICIQCRPDLFSRVNLRPSNNSNQENVTEICGRMSNVSSRSVLMFRDFCGVTLNGSTVSCDHKKWTHASNLYKYSAELICPLDSKISTIVKGPGRFATGSRSGFINLFKQHYSSFCINCRRDTDTYSVCYNFETVGFIQNDSIEIESNRHCGFKVERNRPIEEHFNSSLLSNLLIPCHDNTVVTEMASDQDQDQDLTQSHEARQFLYGLIAMSAFSFVLVIILVLLLIKYFQLKNKKEKATYKLKINDAPPDAGLPHDPYDELDDRAAPGPRGGPKRGPKNSRIETLLRSNNRQSKYWDEMGSEGLES